MLFLNNVYPKGNLNKFGKINNLELRRDIFADDNKIKIEIIKWVYIHVIYKVCKVKIETCFYAYVYRLLVNVCHLLYEYNHKD